MNSENIRRLMVSFFLLIFFISPLKAGDELPIEIDIRLLSDNMDLKEAILLLKKSIAGQGGSTETADSAVSILINMTGEGISVNRAYEVIDEEIRKTGDVSGLASEKNIKKIKINNEIENIEYKAMRRGYEEKDIAVIVEILEELINKGVSLEKACSAVRNVVSTRRAISEIRTLVSSEALKEAGKETIRNSSHNDQIIAAGQEETRLQEMKDFTTSTKEEHFNNENNNENTQKKKGGRK